MGKVQLKLGERVQPTIAVFGAPGSEPILGVFALEGFRLAADPAGWSRPRPSQAARRRARADRRARSRLDSDMNGCFAEARGSRAAEAAARPAPRCLSR